MQFYIREKIFSIRDNFLINDMYNRPWFDCRAEFLSIGHKLHMLNMWGQEVAYIHQKILTFLPHYEIWQNGQMAADLHKKFTFLRDRFEVNAWNGRYEVVGDIWSWNYTIWFNGWQVANISKQFSLFADHYVVDVADNADIPVILCFAIVIDEIKDDRDDRDTGFDFFS